MLDIGSCTLITVSASDMGEWTLLLWKPDGAHANCMQLLVCQSELGSGAIPCCLSQS